MPVMNEALLIGPEHDGQTRQRNLRWLSQHCTWHSRCIVLYLAALSVFIGGRYIDIVMTSSLEMTGACWMSSWCGCPWHTVQYLPLCSRGGGGQRLHTCYFNIPRFRSASFVTLAHKTAPRRFRITWIIVLRSVDAVVHCLSKHGVLLGVWVGVWTRHVYHMSDFLTRCFVFLLSEM